MHKGKPKATRLHEDAEGERLFNTIVNSVDLAQRRIYLSGEIEPGSCHRFLVALHHLDQVKDKPITVVLNSCGGDCEDGFAIYDAIRFAQNEVHVVVFGQASSMGSVILQAGDLRLMSENAVFMIHEGWIGDQGNMTFSQLQAMEKNLKRIEEMANEIVQVRSGQPMDKIVEWTHKETWFRADEAVKLNFADKVITSKKVL